jgi:hypothetical protein
LSLNSYVPPRRAPRLPKAWLAGLASIAAAVVVAGAGLAWNTLRYRNVDKRPITLPDTFLNRGHLADPELDFGQAADWRAHIEDEFHGAGLAGAAYGEIGQGRINVVAIRADATGDLDLKMAADAGEPYGNVRCTNYFRFETEDLKPPPAHMEGMLLCWRTSDDLTVSALAMNLAPAAVEVAAEVDALWQSVRRQG